MTHTPSTPANPAQGVSDEWPPLKKALWRVLMEENLNDGHYIKAFDLIEKLHSAANPAQVTDAMVEAAMSSPPIPGRGPNVFDEGRMRAALTAAIGAGGQAWTVKPLEWSDERGSYANFKFGPETIYYSVDLVVESLDLWSVDTGVIGSDFGRTEMHKCVGREAAKAAAQADYERRILSAIAHPVQPGWRDIPVTDETVTYITQYGGRCRECADAMGVCPTSGLPCDPHEARAAIRHVLRAVNYGFGEGFLSLPAAPQPKGE